MREDAFHINSDQRPTLEMYVSNSGSQDLRVAEPDVFGNVKGGKLWGAIDVDWPDFTEDVFRLLLKTHFDKGDKGKDNFDNLNLIMAWRTHAHRSSTKIMTLVFWLLAQNCCT